MAPKQAKIQATSQQSRFHTETLDPNTTEVDLKAVTVSIGNVELVTDSRLKLKAGIRYALVGRNGTGKSTLLQATAEKLIPGLSQSLRIVLVSQVTDSARALESVEETQGESAGSLSVLQHVVRGDTRRTAAMREFNLLTQAVEAHSISETQRIVSQLRLERLQEELEDAQKVASRTSGQRGKRARDEEIKAEARVKDAQEFLAQGQIQDNVIDQASEMLAEITTTLELLDASTTESRAATILVGLGFSQEMMDSPYEELSGGWRSRCALATSLLVQSDVLLLDEPSNFLDLEATLWLEQFLIEQDRTLVLTSHDQVFLNSVVEETIILRDKALRYFEGTPRAFELDSRKRRKSALKSQAALDKKKEHIEQTISQGMVIGKKTGDDGKLRMAKSRQKKLDERWGQETSTKGTRFKINRDFAGQYVYSLRKGIEIEDLEPRVNLRIPSPDKLRTLGDLVHFDKVSFRYPGAAKPILEDVTFTVEQGGRVAFLGANGQGKSTIAKLVLGELSPTKGTITRHPLLRTGYFSQHSVEELSTVPASTTALQYFLDHFDKRGDKVPDAEARACLGTFGLGGKISSDTPLAMLSGGQKVRLALALLVFRPPPLLLLDEVTTHVDAPTIQALALTLKHYAGGIILVTHDRWFSRVVVEDHSLSSAGAYGSSADPDDDDDGTSTSTTTSDGDGDGDSDGRARRRGLTYRVGGGKVKLLERGMSEYVEMVERRLEKRRRKAAAAAEMAREKEKEKKG